MVTAACHRAESVLKQGGLDGGQVGQTVGNRIPNREKRLRGRRLAQAHHYFAAGHRQQFFGAVKNGVRNWGKRRDEIPRPNVQRCSVDGDGLFGGGADPQRGAIRGKVGAAGGGHGDLRHSRLVRRGEDFDAIHGAIGDEDMFVGGVVGDAAMPGFAGRIIEYGDGVGARVGRSRQQRGGRCLHGEGESGGVR